MSLRELLNQNQPIIGASPMDGITDEVFRLVQINFSRPDIMFTEFVSAEGLSRGGVKLYEQLLYSNVERPIVAQLFGKDPESFYKSAIVVCELGFDGVDINMGCPAKTVTQNGSGAALIGKPELASKIIKAVKKGVEDWYTKKVTINNIGLNKKTLDVIEKNKKYTQENNRPVKGGGHEVTGGFVPTVSVKTRLGISDSIIESWASFILSHDIDFLTVHGRTLRQGYAGTANWDEIQKVVKLNETKTKIFGNGDVISRVQGNEYCQKYGVNGVLIGRSICGNPWIFSDHIPTPRERFSAMLLHSELYKQIYPHRVFDSLRKHFLFYTSGLPNAKQLRAKLVRLNSVSELLQLEDDFLNC